MKIDEILEEYLLCLFIETVTFVLSRIGSKNPDTGENYDVPTILSIAFFQQIDPSTETNLETMKSPIFRALFCLSIAIAKEKMIERRKERRK